MLNLNVMWKKSRVMIKVVIEVIVPHTLKKYQDHVPCSFAYKVVCVDDKFSKPIVLYRGENVA